jgi:hypothetical protein
VYGQANNCATLKRYLDDARYELDDYRRREDDRIELAERACRKRAEERRREYQERLRSASDWPEAFSNGLTLIGREAADEAAWLAEFKSGVGFTFAKWQTEVKRAQELYGEVMTDVERQIAELRAAALNQVADRLATEFGDTGTVQALRENNPEYLTDW